MQISNEKQINEQKNTESSAPNNHIPKRRLFLLLITLSTQTYLENYNPGVDNVVKVDGTFVGVSTPSVAPSVILVPVYA